ncbi:hypothetical protein C8J56DRAFT_881997 [Mycena floridula]|nr:hypothetical protein C8J56DRAFT_881997 [Mycena floridula]
MEPDIPYDDPNQLREDEDTGGELEYYDKPEPEIVDDRSEGHSSVGEDKDFEDGSDYSPANDEPDTGNRALRVGVEASCPMSAGKIRELVVIHFENRLRSRLTWISMIDGYIGPEVTPVVNRYTEDLDILRSRSNRTMTWNEVFPELYQHDSPVGIDGLQYWDGNDTRRFLDRNMSSIIEENARFTAEFDRAPPPAPSRIAHAHDEIEPRPVLRSELSDGYWTPPL